MNHVHEEKTHSKILKSVKPPNPSESTIQAIANWEVKKLVEVCQIGDGNHSGNYPKKNEMVATGIPFIRANNMVNGEVSGTDMKFITEIKHGILKKGHVKTGDILFTNRGEIGKIAIVGDAFNNSNLNSQIAWFRCSNELNNRFLFYYLSSPIMRAYYSVEKNGAALQQFTIRQINNLDIPIPPLPEQKRIVAILDEAFAAIAKAKENAEKNLRNAKELFESYLQRVFANPGEGWEDAILSEMATDITDGDHMPPPKSTSGIPFITISNIQKATNKIDFSDTFLVSNKYYENLKPNRKPRPGDVLYTVTGSFGIPVLIENNQPFCFQRHIGLIRPKESLNPKLLYYWAKSPQAITQANDTATGTAQKTVSLKALRSFTIPRIPLPDQERIVAKLDALAAESKKLEAIYEQKLADLEELKKSILQKAFRGELTAGKSRPEVSNAAQ